LPLNLLRRYKRHFKLPTRPGINKAQLADVSCLMCYIVVVLQLLMYRVHSGSSHFALVIFLDKNIKYLVFFHFCCFVPLHL